MIAEIICVGTELLMGQIVNTNAQFMAEKLAPLGVDLYRQQVVGDNPKRLTEAVLTALSRSDVVLFSGGLGPTEDDLTKETVAAALGLELVLYPEEWDRIVGYFKGRGRMPAPNNKKQAMFPATNCTILPNPRGTAPGCLMEKDGKAAILMPGPPRELRPMFTDYVMPYLEKRSGHRLYTHMLRIFGKGESDVEYELKDLIDSQTNPTLATYCETGEVKLRITAQARDDAEGETLLSPVVAEVERRFGDVVYSENDEELSAVCHRLLLEQGATLSCAESCTGGLLSSAFVDLSGSSAYFVEGDVTYANEAKMGSLGVKAETLERFTAVSEECAREMAVGMRNKARTDYALATTGYAGPDGENVGLVYVSLAAPDGVKVKELHLTGDRNRIRRLAVLHALDMLRRKLCEK